MFLSFFGGDIPFNICLGLVFPSLAIRSASLLPQILNRIQQIVNLLIRCLRSTALQLVIVHRQLLGHRQSALAHCKCENLQALGFGCLPRVRSDDDLRECVAVGFGISYR